MSSKEWVESMLKILEIDEKKIRDQIVHLNGQLVYNQKIQQSFHQTIVEDTPEVTKSKIPRKAKK